MAWRLSPTLESGFCIDALTAALAHAQPLFHNSDQGSQFTSNAYLDVFAAHPTIKISMDGRGRCLDNIFTERLWRSVKYEQVYLNEYTTMDEAHDGLSHYFRFYNEQRPHQSLGYKTPWDIYRRNDH